MPRPRTFSRHDRTRDACPTWMRSTCARVARHERARRVRVRDGRRARQRGATTACWSRRSRRRWGGPCSSAGSRSGRPSGRRAWRCTRASRRRPLDGDGWPPAGLDGLDGQRPVFRYDLGDVRLEKRDLDGLRGEHDLCPLRDRGRRRTGSALEVTPLTTFRDHHVDRARAPTASRVDRSGSSAPGAQTIAGGPLGRAACRHREETARGLADVSDLWAPLEHPGDGHAGSPVHPDPDRRAGRARWTPEAALAAAADRDGVAAPGRGRGARQRRSCQRLVLAADAVPRRARHPGRRAASSTGGPSSPAIRGSTTGAATR